MFIWFGLSISPRKRGQSPPWKCVKRWLQHSTMIVKSRTVFYFAQLVLQKEHFVRCNSFLVFLKQWSLSSLSFSLACFAYQHISCSFCLCLYYSVYKSLLAGYNRSVRSEIIINSIDHLVCFVPNSLSCTAYGI